MDHFHPENGPFSPGKWSIFTTGKMVHFHHRKNGPFFHMGYGPLPWKCHHPQNNILSSHRSRILSSHRLSNRMLSSHRSRISFGHRPYNRILSSHRSHNSILSSDRCGCLEGLDRGRGTIGKSYHEVKRFVFVSWPRKGRNANKPPSAQFNLIKSSSPNNSWPSSLELNLV